MPTTILVPNMHIYIISKRNAKRLSPQAECKPEGHGRSRWIDQVIEQYNKQYTCTCIKLRYYKHSSHWYKYIPAQNTIHQTDIIHSPGNIIQNLRKYNKTPVEVEYPIKRGHSPIIFKKYLWNLGILKTRAQVCESSRERIVRSERELERWEK